MSFYPTETSKAACARAEHCYCEANRTRCCVCGDTYQPSIWWAIAASILLALFLSFSAQAAEFKHEHPQVLPTDEQTWMGCCHNQDCMPAPINVFDLDKDYAMVQVANFPMFKVKRDRIYPSMNGQGYFCRFDINLPPDADNIICIFVVRNFL